jgi:hypothetical protein
MSIPIVNLKTQKARLADFTSGWRRHDHHDGIVFIDSNCTDAFLAAANDETCQAAILAVEEEQKHNDREAFRQAVIDTRQACGDTLGVAYTKSKGFHNQYGELDPAMPQIRELALRHAFLDGDYKTLTSIIENFGQNSVGKKHPKHSRPVSNRVFFAGGTYLKTNEGWYSVPEGDVLYMKAGFEHEPNLQKTDDADFDKLLVISRGTSIYSYE